jgi:maleylpyruvate isomerase
VDVPTADALAAVDAAHQWLMATVADVSDAQVSAPSRLPGWTRGHVLAHLARNADGNRSMVEGALHGEERPQYPGGAEQRAADIDAGAHQPRSVLLEDLAVSNSALLAAWSRLPADAWERTGVWLAFGRQPISRGVGARRREVLVHLVDLDLGVQPSELPADFLVDEATWLREHRTRATWPDAPW